MIASDPALDRRMNLIMCASEIFALLLLRQRTDENNEHYQKPPSAVLITLGFGGTYSSNQLMNLVNL